MGAIRAFFLFQMKMYTVLKNQNRWRFLQWKGRFGLGQITGHPGRFGSEPQCSAQAWLAGPQAWLAGPQAWLAGPQAWLAGPQAWLGGPEGGRTNVRMDGKSPHSTGLHPLSGPLPKNYMRCGE